MDEPLVLEYDARKSVESLMDTLNNLIKRGDRFNEVEAELETIQTELATYIDRNTEAYIQLLKLTLRMTNVVSKIIQLKHQVSG